MALHTARLLALAVGVGAVAASALALVGGGTWLAALASPWRPHLAVVLLACAVVLLVRRPVLAAAMLVAGGVDASAAGARWGPRDVVSGERAVSLVVLNVQQSNPHHDEVIDHLASTGADVLALVEVDAGWERSLRRLEGYPHRLMRPKGGVFGLGLLARWPIRELAVVQHGGTAAKTLVAEIAAPGGPLHVVVTHAWPPTSPETLQLRDAQIRELAGLVGALDAPVVLAGDLNATPWSRPLRSLLASTGLEDSGVGFGLQPTWPHRLAPVGIPIDHVLVSPELAVVAREVGPFVGSDHRSVSVQLAW